METWKYIKELNIYLSDKGNIKVYRKSSNEYFLKTLSQDVEGYLRININKKTYRVHRLVAYYFISKQIEGLTINHKDFNKQNNSVENLEIISASENTMHYIENKRKLKSSSKVLGVGFHSSINKWTARITINRQRVSLGVFNTESEAIEAVRNYRPENVKKGKGKSNIGKSKYSEDDHINALKLAKEIGVRKAGSITGMGSTKISVLRKQYKMVDGKFVKDK